MPSSGYMHFDFSDEDNPNLGFPSPPVLKDQNHENFRPLRSLKQPFALYPKLLQSYPGVQSDSSNQRLPLNPIPTEPTRNPASGSGAGSSYARTDNVNQIRGSIPFNSRENIRNPADIYFDTHHWKEQMPNRNTHPRHLSTNMADWFVNDPNTEQLLDSQGNRNSGNFPLPAMYLEPSRDIQSTMHPRSYAPMIGQNGDSYNVNHRHLIHSNMAGHQNYVNMPGTFENRTGLSTIYEDPGYVSRGIQNVPPMNTVGIQYNMPVGQFMSNNVGENTSGIPDVGKQPYVITGASCPLCGRTDYHTHNDYRLNPALPQQASHPEQNSKFGTLRSNGAFISPELASHSSTFNGSSIPTYGDIPSNQIFKNLGMDQHYNG